MSAASCSASASDEEFNQEPSEKLMAKELAYHFQPIRECIKNLPIHIPNEEESPELVDKATISKLHETLNQFKVTFKFNDYDEKLQLIIDLLEKKNLGDAAAKLSQLKSAGTVVPEFSSGIEKLVEAKKVNVTKLLEYCNAIPSEEKQELLRVRVSHLKAHSKGGVLLKEAIDFAKMRGTWKFYACCICNKKFADKKSLSLHMTNKFMALKTMVALNEMPSKVGRNWEEMLLDCPWTPVDIDDTMKMTEVKNSERGEILEKIGEIFRKLVEQELLNKGQLQELLEITKKELPGVVAEEWHHMINSLARTPLCFRLLRTPQLNTVLNFVQEIWDFSSSIGIKPKDLLQDYGNPLDSVQRNESIVFYDFSLLQMDERVLLLDLSSDDDFTVAYPVRDSAKFMNWLTKRFKSSQLLTSWRCSSVIQSCRGVALFLAAVSGFICLKYLYMIKHDCLAPTKVFQTIKDMWTEELRKRVDFDWYVPKKLSDLLRERFIELEIETNRDDNDDGTAIILSTSIDVECKIISSILEEGKKLFEENKQLKEDGCYLTALENIHRNQPFTEHKEIDEITMRIQAGIRQHQRDMVVASTFDFRVIMVSFMKKFIWRQLIQHAKGNSELEVAERNKKIEEIRKALEKIEEDKREKAELVTKDTKKKEELVIEDTRKNEELLSEEIRKKAELDLLQRIKGNNQAETSTGYTNVKKKKKK